MFCGLLGIFEEVSGKCVSVDALEASTLDSWGL